MKKVFWIVFFTIILTCNICFANLKLKFLNVGQGDSILIQTSTQNVLIDTSDVDERSKLERELFKAGAFRLDKIILTHPHIDHIGNCAYLVKSGVFKVKSIFDNGVVSNSKSYQNYITECLNRNVPVYSLQPGVSLDFGDNVSFTVLSANPNADKLNNSSIVARLQHGNFSALLTGDAESSIESELLPSLQPCTLLQAPHHGSFTSSSLDFVKKVNPSYVVISAGEPTFKRGGNTYGHPHLQPLNNFLTAGIPSQNIFWTFLNGTVTFTSDGTNFSVATDSPQDWVNHYIQIGGSFNIIDLLEE